MHYLLLALEVGFLLLLVRHHLPLLPLLPFPLPIPNLDTEHRLKMKKNGCGSCTLNKTLRCEQTSDGQQTTVGNGLRSPCLHPLPTDFHRHLRADL